MNEQLEAELRRDVVKTVKAVLESALVEELTLELEGFGEPRPRRSGYYSRVVERALRFYRDGLGFRTEGIVGQEFEHGAVAFFDLQPGLRLALWPRQSISHDSGVDMGAPSPTEFTPGHKDTSTPLALSIFTSQNG